MAKTNKKLTVREIQIIEPKAEVFELSPYSKYLVFIPRSRLAMEQNVDLMQKAQQIAKNMSALNIPCAILIGADKNDIQILELKAEKV
jgi:hypothetical protein